MKGALITAIIIVIFSLSPFYIALLNQVNLNAKVDSPYLNGLISACGIFVAFISASVISKARDLDSFNIWLMRCTLLAFVASIIELSNRLIVNGYPVIWDLALFSMTLIFASFSAWNIMTTLYRKAHS